MRILLLFAFIFISLQTYSQLDGFALLRDKEVIDFTSFRMQKETVVIKRKDNNSEQKIDAALVDLLYFERGDDYYYVRKDASGARKDYMLIQRDKTGKINIYKETVPVGNGSVYTYFFEKDGKFEYLYSPQAIKKEKEATREKLRNYFSENPAIASLVTPDFKIETVEIYALVQAYNLSQYKEPSTDGAQTELTIYRRKNDGPDQRITLQYNGKTYTLEAKQSITLQVPVGEHIKICYGRTEKDCELFQIPKGITGYYEVVWDRWFLHYIFNQADQATGKIFVERFSK